MMLSRVIRILPLLPVLLVAQPAQDPAALGGKALDLLLAGNYAELSQMFTTDMKKALPVETLAKIGTQIKTWGAAQTIGEPSARKAGPNTIVDTPVKFATQNINFRFTIDRDGLVAGMFQLPGEVDWQRPAYSKPDSFRERAVTVGDGQWKLPGALIVPLGKGPFPGIVLVHGSGPNDRDETVGGNKVFKDLAEGHGLRFEPSLQLVTSYVEVALILPREIQVHAETVIAEVAFHEAAPALEQVLPRKTRRNADLFQKPVYEYVLFDKCRFGYT